MKLLHRGKHAAEDGQPHIPFYKDERFAHFLTARAIAITLLVFIIAFVVTFTWGLLKISDLTQANKNQTNKYTQIQTQNHQDRLDEDTRQNEKIRNLACTFDAVIPPANATLKKLGDGIRKEYNCPPFGQPFTPTTLEPITPSQSASQNSQQPAPNSSSSVKSKSSTSPVGLPRPTVTVTHTSPQPTVTATHTSTATVTAPPAPLLSSICAIAKAPILC